MAEDNPIKEIRFDDPWDGELICRALNPDQPFRVGFDRCIAVTRGGKLLGGVMIDGFLHKSVQMHVAAFEPDWLTRGFLWVIFDYCFNQLGVDVIYGPVESANEKAIKFDLKIGFKEQTRLPGAVVGGDLIIFSMYRADCRWLNLRPAFVPGATS